jgi:trk system potassium uptake protein TrkH
MFSKGLLLLLMVVGACAGSTAGGLKCARLLLLFKSLGRNIRKLVNPKKVQVVRINGRAVGETVIDHANAYLAAYVIIIVLSFLVISIDNQTIGTNLSAVLACFNNIGPGMEAVGPTCNFGFFSPLSKLVLIFDMLAGRLEIFPILILFSSYNWKRK